jgi:hypothetical protein
LPVPSAVEEPKPEARSEPTITFAGYTEAFYQWNLNDPSNHITNFRGFDNRHNTLTLSNAVLDGQVAYEGAQARVAADRSTPALATRRWSPERRGQCSRPALPTVQQACAG